MLSRRLFPKVLLRIPFTGYFVIISLFSYSQDLTLSPGTHSIYPTSSIQHPASSIQHPESGLPLLFPWSGGLNSCQFCTIDFNLDGIKDILVFDRHGNRRLTFINHGTPGTFDYSLAPDFALMLPDLHDWVITLDYDRDGKMDIFTYGMGGVRVFRNISDNTLQFTLVTDLLESFYYTGKVGILVTSVDYPAITDIDGDGDADLLTFFGLGAYLEYHRNLSMEKYGHCDSLDFRLEDPCWGKFKESEGGNRITLNAPCNFEKSEIRNLKSEIRNPKHTGSTLLATDLNSDGVKDLVIGDVDYPGLIALYNGGTPDSAYMVEQDTAFPAASAPVHLFSFPATSMLDVNNDGLEDLLVSPFDPALFTSDNFHCIWYYRNTGSAGMPRFEKQPEDPFRKEMLDYGSASHPVLYDFDGDGMQDLFVGNEGFYDSSYYESGILRSSYPSRIAYYRNTGSATRPVFSFVTGDLATLSGLNLRGAYPAFGDLNGDGLTDMLVGNSDGSMLYFRNEGGVSGIPLFAAPVVHWQGIDVGEYSAPQLFDLDKDGLVDLVAGERNGNINWFRNTGSEVNPVFTKVTDSLGGVNVTNYSVSWYGFSTPCFTRMPDGLTLLIAGSDEGRIHLFTAIDGNLTGKFHEQDSLFNWLSQNPADTLFGWQTSPAIGHLTDQTGFDLITGNFSGGLNYITKRLPADIIPGIRDRYTSGMENLLLYPNPADQTVTIRLPKSRIPHPGSDIVIHDFLGRALQKYPFNGNLSVPLTGLPDGVYLVSFSEFRAKLIIRHR